MLEKKIDRKIARLHKFNAELKILIELRKLEEIIEKELKGRNEEPTDENILSFLENNEELLSKRYIRVDGIAFENVINQLIFKKKESINNPQRYDNN